MKHFLILFFLVFQLSSAKSQIVFCPQGAEWSYNFYWWSSVYLGSQNTLLEKIRYTRDSILDSINVKILEHGRFYLQCGGVEGLTLIKQAGDTVFMRNNETDHNWEILYNFNVSAGNEWETHIKVNSYPETLAMYTYTIHVDSVGFTNINGFNLKRLFVHYKRPNPFYNLSYPAVILERFGTNAFLFNYYNTTYGGCDGDSFLRFLCYQDKEFGNKQFSAYPCNYSNPLGIIEQQKELTKIRLYPNPINNVVNLELQNSYPYKNYSVQIISIEGLKILEFDQQQVENSTLKLDVTKLEKGLYFLQLSTDGVMVGRKKFVKE